MNSKKILNILAWGGLLAIASTPLLFNLPVFGMGTLAVILATFFWFQRQNLKLYTWAQNEHIALADFKSKISQNESLDDFNSQGILLERIQHIRKAISVNVEPLVDDFLLPTPIRDKESGANLVVILGLMGTFFGLLSVVGNAGSVYSTAGGTRDLSLLLPQIFANMQGLFGSSFAGLLASLLLTLSHHFVLGEWNKIEEELDLLTRYELLPQMGAVKHDAQREDLVLLISEVKALRSDFVSHWTSQVEKVQTLGQNDRNEFIQSSQNLLKENVNSLQSQFNTFQNGLLEHHKSLSEQMNQRLEAWSQIFETNLKSQFATLNDSNQKALIESQAVFQKVTEEFAAIPQNSQNVLKEFAQNLNANVNEHLQNLSQAPEQILKISHQQSDLRLQEAQELKQEIHSFQSQIQVQISDFVSEVQKSLLNVNDSFANFGREGLEKFRQDAQSLIGASAEVLSSGAQKAQESIQSVAQLESLFMGIMQTVETSVNAMRIQQIEMSTSLEMFRDGIDVLVQSQMQSEQDGSEINQIAELVQQSQSAIAHVQNTALQSLESTTEQTQQMLLEVLHQLRGARS